MYYGGSHLGFPIGIKNRNFVEDLPMIILGQFGFNCPSGFREEASGMIIGRSCTNCLFFMPIGNPRWPPLQENVQMHSSQKLQI
jgi:hypothetical protein